jgi:hypothetical protein
LPQQLARADAVSSAVSGLVSSMRLLIVIPPYFVIARLASDFYSTTEQMFCQQENSDLLYH